MGLIGVGWIGARHRAVAGAGVVCAVGYQYRALDLPTGLRPRVLLGRGLSRAVARPWFGDPTQGGSQILERASHLIDLQRALAGEVDRVSGMGQRGLVSLILAFAPGALGTVVVGRISSSSSDAASIWTPAIGTILLSDYLAANGVQVPVGWSLATCYTVSADGRWLVSGVQEG